MILELSNVERLQLLRRERDELAALILGALDDLFPLDLLATAGVVRPKSDAGCRPGLIHHVISVIRGKSWRRWSVGESLSFG